MSPLPLSLIVLLASIVVCFLLGLITKNYSWVDRLWSVLPPLYVCIWLPLYVHNPRFIIAAILVLLWGIRLTVNFALKGGYTFSFSRGFTGEDYRWEYLRKKINNPVLFELFNFFFISAFQLGLIFLFTLPLYFYGKIEGPVLPAEMALYVVHLLLLVLETISDIQQLRFYRRRGERPWSNQKRYQLGFNTFGLWKYSRHPNYVCEMGQWLVLFLYLVVASGELHFSGIGALLLILLFAGSTRFTETITESKYPDYKEWKRVTSVWIPVKSFFKDRKGFWDMDSESQF
jgi:steroid 5-alpha reductase family enzyme